MLILYLNVAMLAIKNNMPALLWWIRSIYLQDTGWSLALLAFM
jgi:hypothetical protein